MKKILVLGGTQFVGRNLVEQLIAQGHTQVTLFNRGITGPSLFPNLRHISGDRNTEDILKVTHENWDIIFDVSSYFPIPLQQLLEQLQGKVGHYIYVSTGSAYQLDPNGTDPMDEQHPVVTCSEEEKTNTEAATYNARKSECERVLLSFENIPKTIFRLGLVIGQYDHTDRLYYWFHKLHTQRPFLIPNHGKNKIAYSDVLDLSRVMIKAMDKTHQHTIYNANSYNASFEDFLKIARNKLSLENYATNITPQQFNEHQLRSWMDLPLWVNGDYFTLDNTKLKQDFDIRWNSIEQTTAQLIHYYSKALSWRKPESPYPPLSDEQEKEIIKKLQN